MTSHTPLYVTIVPNDRLPQVAESLLPDTEFGGQWTTDEQTAFVWSLEGPHVTQQAHLNLVMHADTWHFFDALSALSDLFGLNIPCVQA